jgi:hypothetical protein
VNHIAFLVTMLSRGLRLLVLASSHGLLVETSHLIASRLRAESLLRLEVGHTL